MSQQYVFGLLDRALLHNAFLAMAIGVGVTCLLIDVVNSRPQILAVDLIMNRDRRATGITLSLSGNIISDNLDVL